MNGLAYIRIRCNLSQAFLARQLGVSRQAVNLWEQLGASLSEKRQAQLEEFFGISRKYFGDITPSEVQEIDEKPLYLQLNEGHEYYSFSSQSEYTRRPVSQTYFPSTNDHAAQCSLSERLARAKGEYGQILSEAQALPAKGNIISQLAMTARISFLYGILTDILQEISDKRYSGWRCPMYQVLKDIVMATGIAYGCLDSAEIKPEVCVAPDGNVINNYLDYEWMLSLAATMREHLMVEVDQRQEDLHLKNERRPQFPPIVTSK